MGYTGGDNPDPTYKSVCSGDGHTEALKVVFDPTVLSYEQLITQYFEDPRVKEVWPGDSPKPQYKSAVWAQNMQQKQIARAVSDDVGKSVPVLPCSKWFDAEDWHQHFMTEFKDFPEDEDGQEYAAF